MKILVLISCLVRLVFCDGEICGGTYRGFQYTIVSPNYPRDYPDRSNCVYHLQGDTSATCEQEFHFQFLDFNLRASDNCKGDYLQVGDRHIFCGNTFGLRRFTGKNNSLTVIFHSDEKETTKGFKILVTALPCSLKLNPLKNHSYKEITSEGGTGLSLNDIPRSAYHRGIRGDSKDDNLANRPTPSSNDSRSTSSSTLSEQAPPIDFSIKDNDESRTLTQLLLRPAGADTSENSPRITSYLFVPPSEKDTTTFNSLTTTIRDKALFNTVTSPPNELLPPSKSPAVTFSKVQFPKDRLALAALDKSSSLSGQAQKLAAAPARNYGEPGIGVVDYDIQTVNDCDRITGQQSHVGSVESSEKINYDPLQGQAFPGIGNSFGSNPNLIYDPRYGFVSSNNNPGNNYYPSQNYPGGYYPNNNPSVDYANGIDNPSIGYPGGNYNPNLGSNYPVGGYNPIGNYPSYPNYPEYPTAGYNPDYNTGFNPTIPNYNNGYNPISPNYNPGYNPISPNYNPGYNPVIPNYNPGFSPSYPNYNSGYNPSVGGSYYPNYGFNGQSGECCRVQSSRRFMLVSPGFPAGVSSANTYSCRYTITKSSPDVCRLRLNFRFFNFGAEDPYCSYGYVEIDGRRYCGCKTDQTAQVLFTDYIAKTISVTYVGYPRTRFSGFLIDVIQEACGSYPSYPQNPYDPINPIYPNYPGYIQRRQGESNSTVGQSNIQRSHNSTVIFSSPTDLNPHIRGKRDLGYSYPRPSVPFPNKDVQLIPSIVGGKTHDRLFGGSCQNRVFFNWVIASKEALLRNARCTGSGAPRWNARLSYLPASNRESKSSASTACEEINVSQGVIKSPLYPNNYPDNVKTCYRFNKAPNFCKLEVYIKDFELESSQNCAKDYFSFNTDNKKYCGQTLNDFRTVFDLTRTNSLDIYFVSDSHGTARGFNIGFSQLPCEAAVNF